MRARRLIAPAMLLLAGCGGVIPRADSLPDAPKGPARTEAPAARWPERGPRPASPATTAPAVAQAGGAGDAGPLAGWRADAVTRRFGVPALDVVEGPGRRLQFRGACVLDVFFYAPAPDRPAVATHIDARDTNGAGIDRAQCIERLTRAR